MKRVKKTERPDWKADAEVCGFTIHSINGERYWDERHAYEFTLTEIEKDLEAPSEELMSMCYRAVDRIITDRGLMRRMAIPDDYHDGLIASWKRRDYDLYGRFDLVYDGNGPAKMLEFNADTPTSLFESAVFQWRWLEDMKARGHLPAAADQFNSIHERLIDALRSMKTWLGRMHFAGIFDTRKIS